MHFYASNINAQSRPDEQTHLLYFHILLENETAFSFGTSGFFSTGLNINRTDVSCQTFMLVWTGLKTCSAVLKPEAFMCVHANKALQKHSSDEQTHTKLGSSACAAPSWPMWLKSWSWWSWTSGLQSAGRWSEVEPLPASSRLSQKLYTGHFRRGKKCQLAC